MMSFPIRVKQEESEETPPDDISNVATDDSETEDNISIDNLQPLVPKVASQTKFPVGCKVWYDARKSRASRVLRAKSGIVVGVYFDFTTYRHVYRVSSAADCEEHTLYEDRLMYGINCPVRVTNPDTNEAVDGVIVVPKLDAGNDGKQHISYAVQFTEGRRVSVEFLVAADRIVYREDKVVNELVGMNDNIIEDTKETNNTQGDAEMKESKADTNLEVTKAAPTNEGEALPQTPSKHTVVDERKVAANDGEADKSVGQIASKKTENDDAVRNVASNEYSKLADISKQQTQQIYAAAMSGATATPSTARIDNEHKELKSSPLVNVSWEPPTQEKTPQVKGGNGLEVGASSAQRNRGHGLEAGALFPERKRSLGFEGGPSSPERRRSLGSEGGASSLERKRSFGSEGGERPNKMIKTEISESKGPGSGLTCTLTIPDWVYHIRGRKRFALFYHLLGVKDDGFGHKTKHIESMTSCRISISGKHHPMKIDITSNSALNIPLGISMIEESLVEYISDGNSEIRLLYDLIATAEGSYKFKRNDGWGMLLREYEGIKSWWALFELPYKAKEGGKAGEYHGKFLLNLPLQGDCKIDLFGDTFGAPLAHTSPFVLIRGTKHRDVKDAVSEVRNAMIKHQSRRRGDKGGVCGCTPKW